MVCFLADHKSIETLSLYLIPQNENATHLHKATSKTLHQSHRFL
jgi:hypothetical protein